MATQSDLLVNHPGAFYLCYRQQLGFCIARLTQWFSPPSPGGGRQPWVLANATCHCRRCRTQGDGLDRHLYQPFGRIFAGRCSRGDTHTPSFPSGLGRRDGAFGHRRAPRPTCALLNPEFGKGTPCFPESHPASLHGPSRSWEKSDVSHECLLAAGCLCNGAWKERRSPDSALP